MTRALRWPQPCLSCFIISAVSALPSHPPPSLPFSCWPVARQHSSGVERLAGRALLLLPGVAAGLGVGQHAEGQRQPSMAVAFSPRGENLPQEGKYSKAGDGVK